MGGARRTPASEGEDGEAVLRRRSADEQLPELARRFGEALRAGDPAAAEVVANDALHHGLPVETIYSRVIAPAMAWIGQLWQKDEISVAGEHLATAISQGVMARLFPRLLLSEPRSRERVMLAATQGEHHVTGLKMVADALEGAGYDVLNLGPDVPVEALLEACRSHRPVVLGLTVSMYLNVPTMLWAIGELASLEQPPAVMVGGRAIGEAVKRGLRAPVIEDCAGVVHLVEGLIANKAPREPVLARLAKRVPPGPAASVVGGQSPATMAGAFAATSLVAADAAREAARHAVKLESLAYRDGLTGLWNRRAYDDRIAALSEERSADCAALMLDVDNFKGINDTFGHDAGDQGLIRVGRAILKSVRSDDFAARYGGDEFVVLLPGMPPAGAARLAERIREAVEEDGSEPPLTVSIGVAGLSADVRATSLSVDQALYEAKQAGRNQVARASG